MLFFIPDVFGPGSPENGSGITAARVTGAGLNVTLPLRDTPPFTWITDAVILALPVARGAFDDLEST